MEGKPVTRKRKAKAGQIDLAAFAETERDPVTRGDVESVMRQVMEHPAQPVRKSENREPSKEEMGQRWKLVREE